MVVGVSAAEDLWGRELKATGGRWIWRQKANGGLNATAAGGSSGGRQSAG
jgi:hypothetical protein